MRKYFCRPVAAGTATPDDLKNSPVFKKMEGDLRPIFRRGIEINRVSAVAVGQKLNPMRCSLATHALRRICEATRSKTATDRNRNIVRLAKRDKFFQSHFFPAL